MQQTRSLYTFHLYVRIAILLAVLRFGIQSPNSTATVATTANSSKSMSGTSCPGYRTGNLRNSGKSVTGCKTGTGLGPVDHGTAFGFERFQNPNWRSCGDLETKFPNVKYVLFIFL